jgi:hypothetical protein
MTDLKHLVSPFALVPSVVVRNANANATPRHAPPCNCDDSDEENDFGMAPECAFVCNALTSSLSPKKGKSKNNSNSNSNSKRKNRDIKRAKTKTRRRTKH